MVNLYLHCNECGSSVEVRCDGDNPVFCPECRTVDNFSEIDDNILDKYVLVNGTWRRYSEANTIQ